MILQWNLKMKSIKKRGGFTLIELLVVIAVIALLMAVIIPALGKAKSYAQRIVCRNNLRQQGFAVVLYSNDNDTYVPSPIAYTISGTGVSTNVTIAGPWFWDISFWFTNQLAHYGGFDATEVFTCPSNKTRKFDDARWWQFSLLQGSGTYPKPVNLSDESGMSQSAQKAAYRVPPYVYLIDKYVPEYQHGISLYSTGAVPSDTQSNKPMVDVVFRKLSDAKSAGSKPMILDAVISDSQWRFTEITEGGLDEMTDGQLYDQTNHLARQTVRLGSVESLKPAGANIAYGDGHAEWKDTGASSSSSGEYFQNIKPQYQYGEMFWW